jgi:glycosyltransferase involved in cell wall biosynthesis
MRIGMITGSLMPPVEGVGFYAWNLARHLTQQGHQVQLIARGDTRPLFCEKVDGITIWRPTFWPVYPWQAHMHGLFVDKLLKQLEPELDLIHLHTPLIKYPRTNLPTLVTVHTPMKSHSASFPATTVLACLVKVQAIVGYGLEREIFKRADKLTAVARSVAQDMETYGITPEHVDVLGNGVDTEIFFPEPEKPQAAEPYILTVGRLGLRKGLEDLIQCAELVCRQFPSHKFYIAGSGPLESALRADYIAKHNLEDQVILLGHVASRARLAELYRGATLFVHAAHYEGLPTVLLEAMACGRPVIATAVSGALDVVENGRNGLLVPPKQPAEMAQAIIRLLREPLWGEQLAAAGLKTIQERYAWTIICRDHITEYERLCSGLNCRPREGLHNSGRSPIV